MDEEVLICEFCDEEVYELFETIDGTQLCSSCLEEDGYEQCEHCERWFNDNLTETPAGETLCDECIQRLTYDDFVGSYRFLMDTVNYETLYMDKNLVQELRDKLTALIKRVLIEGDKESKKALETLYTFKPDDNNEFTVDLLDDIIRECMSNENIVETLNAFDYDVQDATMSEGAHGHDTYGVIFVR